MPSPNSPETYRRYLPSILPGRKVQELMLVVLEGVEVAEVAVARRNCVDIEVHVHQSIGG